MGGGDLPGRQQCVAAPPAASPSTANRGPAGSDSCFQKRHFDF